MRRPPRWCHRLRPCCSCRPRWRIQPRLQRRRPLGSRAPARVTPAAAPLGTGEEWVLAVEGVMQAESSYAMDVVTADMTGTIGYSFCSEGDEASCPFYVGSMGLMLTEPLVLELDCGGPTETHELEELEIRLAQPALGIAQDNTSWKAFPPRSVVVEATGIVDGFPIRAMVEGSPRSLTPATPPPILRWLPYGALRRRHV